MRIAFTSRGPARASDDSNVTVQGSQRRSFLRLVGSGLLGATGVAGLGGLARAEASEFEPLWNSAQVLIGNSPTDQDPSPVIQCPLFFDNGHFAHASHTLDLSNLPRVSGTITVGKDTIEPDFSSSVAAAATLGTDGICTRGGRRGHGHQREGLFPRCHQFHRPVQIQSDRSNQSSLDSVR